MKKRVVIIFVFLMLIILLIGLYFMFFNKNIYYTVKFDTNGGNIINPIKILKGEKIENIVPIKDGYTFKGWIYNDEIFSQNTKITKNITLKANWIENSKVYYCDKDYELDSDKCIKVETIKGNIKKECPIGSKEIDNKCIDINNLKDLKGTCPNNGVYYKDNICLYGFLEEYPTKESCENRGHTFKNNKCYQARIERATVFCPSGYIKYNSKCAKVVSKEEKITCPKDYNLNNNKCERKIIKDAYLK